MSRPTPTPYDTPRARWIGRLGAGLLSLLGATWRVRWLGREHWRACQQAPGGFIYAFWHGQLLPLAYAHRGLGVTVLVSLNRDGEYITQVIERLGYTTIRGSTSRGGSRALLAMVRHAETGAAVAFTPDGPRGPRHRVQAGVLLCAQRAQVPILPLTMACRPAKQLDSWDRFQIPLPGARQVIVYGEPLTIPAQLATSEMLREWTPRLEAALSGSTERAERALDAWATTVGEAHP